MHLFFTTPPLPLNWGKGRGGVVKEEEGAGRWDKKRVKSHRESSGELRPSVKSTG